MLQTDGRIADNLPVDEAAKHRVETAYTVEGLGGRSWGAGCEAGQQAGTALGAPGTQEADSGGSTANNMHGQEGRTHAVVRGRGLEGAKQEERCRGQYITLPTLGQRHQARNLARSALGAPRRHALQPSVNKDTGKLPANSAIQQQGQKLKRLRQHANNATIVNMQGGKASLMQRRCIQWNYGNDLAGSRLGCPFGRCRGLVMRGRDKGPNCSYIEGHSPVKGVLKMVEQFEACATGLCH